MISLRIYLLNEIRNASTQRLERCLVPLHVLSPQRFCHSSDDNGKQMEKSKSKEQVKKEKKENAKKHLNDLLESFHKKSHSPEQKIKIFKAKPKKVEVKEEKIEIIDFSLRKAAENVAKSFGGDEKETESELLNALKSHASPKQSLRDLLSNMSVSKQSKDPSIGPPTRDGMPRSRLYEFRRENDQAGTFDSRSYTPIDLYSAPPLKIFPKDFKAEGEESVLPTWDKLLEREKKFNVINQPRNYFEEMIKWTEEGKVWTFPVDNEIGLEEEKSVSFADHIFLEKHLEGWCPEKGPIRHFMELVCVGLSKNPYITAERKRAHIEWYKNYFDSKSEVLRDIGAM